MRIQAKTFVDMAQEPISPVTSSKPELTISEAAINAEPVELDGTPTSPERASGTRRSSKQEDLSPEEVEVLHLHPLTHYA